MIVSLRQYEEHDSSYLLSGLEKHDLIVFYLALQYDCGSVCYIAELILTLILAEASYQMCAEHGSCMALRIIQIIVLYFMGFLA